MSQAKNDFKKEMERGLDEMRRLRDEVRVQLHLAGMDAKEAWRHLEPRIEAAEKEVERGFDAATRATVDQAIKKLRELRETMMKKGN